MIKTVYEDEYLLVVDKPSGLLVTPTPRKETNTLTQILNEEAKKNNPNLRIYPCHRLDRETSGLIIYAKTKRIQQLMMEKFRLREIEKEYAAIVQGGLKKSSGQIKSYITDNPRERPRLAITNYKVVKYLRGLTQVKVMPMTGRTNQIRIHFKQLGHPLLGESRFAFRKDFAIRFKRAALHAESIMFAHPITGEKLCLISPLPQDLEVMIKNFT